ncbi:FUSC family protein [Marinobacter persicus]|uniref:Fusaric acid resistance family protein n=2 Tax=Marinobacter persicus TaxID=930118 RepID=A0A2S6G6U0_9GAMM|nr:FUSC family protein [Marinobacter persicus]PPK51654.1 hypothetical protein BY455_11052 [Marinobacter persicus]PPK54874.1 hypothetical protein B0H24_100952 [Marinobacter persicus]PPK58592.1 hypothetical protein BY454_10852 [Marinobacter persicus]
MYTSISKVKSRSMAARFLLSRVQLSESLAMVSQSGARNSRLAGLQVAVTALVVLPLIQVSSFSDLIGFASLGTLVALFGRFAPPARRGMTVFLCVLCQTFTVFGMSLVAWLDVPMGGQLAILALVCGILFYIVNVADFGPPGALIFIFAASVSMGQVDEFATVLERSSATALAAMLAWLLVLSTERFRHDVEVGPAWFSDRPTSDQLLVVGRIILGAAVSGLVAYSFGGDHAGWAAMGAVVVLQGSHLHISMNRALQRAGGQPARGHFGSSGIVDRTFCVDRYRNGGGAVFLRRSDHRFELWLGAGPGSSCYSPRKTTQVGLRAARKLG